MKELKKLKCPYHKVLPEHGIITYNSYSSDHFWRCPLCNKCNPTPKKFNRFGYGFWSSYGEIVALRNWNNAVCRFMKRAIISVMNGKDIVKNFNTTQSTPILCYGFSDKTFHCAE